MRSEYKYMSKKIFFVSLGCDKNLVDSEKMLGMLSRDSYEITDDEAAADVIVINTCCFINDAKEESIQAILEMGQLRREGSCKALIVTGCLAQRYRQEIIDEIPEVDAVIGTSAYDQLTGVIKEVLGKANSGKACESGEEEGRGWEREPVGRIHVLNPDENPAGGDERLVTTGGHYAYLKIAEGCNKRCTYCIIPYLRGHYRSFPMEQLVAEAEKLAEGGVKELILVAQETTLYGTDLYGKKMLHELIRKLARIPQIRWIRLLYCYPEEIYDELISVMKEEEKVCHYLDLPIQHADDQILRRMGRRTNRAELTALIEKLRREIPDIILRTTLITGFPGETQQAHETLMDFVDETEFDRLGVFAYSPEEGTPAADMPDQISEEVKAARLDEIMALQQEIAFDLAERRVGETLWVMVEGRVTEDAQEFAGDAAAFDDEEEGDVYVCRTYADAPGVDGYLFLRTNERLMTGDFVQVRVTGANEYDLTGEMVNNETGE